MTTRPAHPIATAAALAAALFGAACSPALDWREFVPEGSAISASFPCRPDRHARPVTIAGASLPMEMLVCSAGDTTFALAFVDVAEPARIGPTLAALREAAVGNVKGSAPQFSAWQIPGMTPNPQSARLAVSGRLPDGAAVQEQAVFFTRGLRVYQASVFAAQLAPATADTFLTALRFPA